jgi:peptidoglycan/xylan/chitin deacetylase (PgdA/CDA1 family)
MSAPTRRHRIAKALKLAALAVLGLCSVSIPVTLAVVLSATGSSDVLVLGDLKPAHEHATPAHAVAGLRCVARRGYYALTFEDGPVAATTPRLVAALRRSRAVATFFDVGRSAAARRDLVELQRRVGQVANHSYTHPRWSGLSSARRLQELQATARVLDYPNALLRPPDGAGTPRLARDLRRTGLAEVLWTVDTEDRRLGVRGIVARAQQVGPGGILLLHEGLDQSAAAIPPVVASLRRRGLCPGFLAPSRSAQLSPDGIPFGVRAVRP